MALISIKAISKMLEECAPGFSMELKTHNRVVRFNGKTYPALPKHDEIEAGHVRKLARNLDIFDCAKKSLGF